MTAISRHLSIVSNNCRRGAALSEEIRDTTTRVPPNESAACDGFLEFVDFVWSLGFGFWDFRGASPAALWLKRDRYHKTPFSPWFRTPLVKRGNGRLVE